jgi:hypothetical protein
MPEAFASLGIVARDKNQSFVDAFVHRIIEKFVSNPVYPSGSRHCESL